MVKSRRNTKWTMADRQIAITMYFDGRTIGEIAKLLKRTKVGIACKINQILRNNADYAYVKRIPFCQKNNQLHVKSTFALYGQEDYNSDMDPIDIDAIEFN